MDTQSRFDPVEPLYDARIRGAALIGTAAGRRVHLHAGCWVAPCASEPPRLMVAFPKEFEGAEIVARGGAFTVSLTSTQEAEWLDAFFQGDQAIGDDRRHLFLRSSTGCPVPGSSVAYFDCRLRQSVDLGDFLLAIWDVVSAEVLNPGYRNLTVNELVARRDPRGSQEARLPFEGFDCDLTRLAPAPGGPVSAERFAEIYARRAWGLFFVSTAQGGRGHFHMGCWMMQVSHDPPRMAIAMKKGWEGTDWVASGAPFAMTLIADDQGDLVRAFTGGARSADALAKELEPLGDGLFALSSGIAWFRCQPESVHDVGDARLCIGRVDRSGWIRPDRVNLTDQGASGLVDSWREIGQGFPLPTGTG